MKKMTMAEMATLESIAAKSTSEVKNRQHQAMKGGERGKDSQLYLVHQEK
jgi:hypothetical protein